MEDILGLWILVGLLFWGMVSIWPKEIVTLEQLQKEALYLCMTCGARYLDCLYITALRHENKVPWKVFKEIETDYKEYIEKMTKAGIPTGLEIVENNERYVKAKFGNISVRYIKR
jgi:hypothetical protein